MKIKSSHLNDVDKRFTVAKKLIHVNHAKKFYKKQQEVVAMCKDRDNVGALVFD